MSFHALESDGKDDDKQWLTYWVVFGLFTIADQCAGFILRFIPFYYVLKFACLIWLFHPKSRGATTVYNEFIRPYAEVIKKGEQEIKEAAEKKFSEAKKTFGSQ